MYVLIELCVVALTNVALNNGMETNRGMVALYGKDDVVRTMYRNEAVEAGSHLKQFFQKYIPYYKFVGRKREDVHFCLPQKARIEDLEEYLRSLGFQDSKYINEENTARMYMDKSKNKLNSGLLTVEQHDSDEGKRIAAAFTMGHIKIVGPSSCGSSENNQAIFDIQMNSPLNMGTLNIIFLQKFKHYTAGLVYINGNLRLIRKEGDSDKNKEPWRIYPHLDSIHDKGLINRSQLDSFLEEWYFRENCIKRSRIDQQVLIGGIEKRENY